MYTNLTLPAIDLFLTNLFSVREKRKIKYYSQNEHIEKEEKILLYEGKIDQCITRAIITSVEKTLDELQEQEIVKKQLFHIVIALLQNIGKYSDNRTKGKGAIIVVKDDEKYSVITINEVRYDKISHLSFVIELANRALDQNELNKIYQKKISSVEFNENGGVGLGLINVVRKTRQKIEYEVQNLKNGNNSLFYIKTSVLLEEGK